MLYNKIRRIFRKTNEYQDKKHTFLFANKDELSTNHTSSKTTDE